MSCPLCRDLPQAGQVGILHNALAFLEEGGGGGSFPLNLLRTGGSKALTTSSKSAFVFCVDKQTDCLELITAARRTKGASPRSHCCQLKMPAPPQPRRRAQRLLPRILSLQASHWCSLRTDSSCRMVLLLDSHGAFPAGSIGNCRASTNTFAADVARLWGLWG